MFVDCLLSCWRSGDSLRGERHRRSKVGKVVHLQREEIVNDKPVWRNSRGSFTKFRRSCCILSGPAKEGRPLALLHLKYCRGLQFVPGSYAESGVKESLWANRGSGRSKTASTNSILRVRRVTMIPGGISVASGRSLTAGRGAFHA